jgi:FAD/FMN-containing dehydrogenase
MANTTAAAEQLRATLLGDVIVPGDEHYDAARAIWNGNIQRRPAIIARCRGTADVAAAVRCAREHDLEATVRGGGHAVAGYALCDDGLVIDLSEMRGCRLDPTTRRVRVEGGALNADVDRETQRFGVAITGGIVSHTGIGGLTLGGGIGHVMRKFGLTIDNLASCDVVTADGDFVVASAQENADLFWALRGGGGNFGIVTNFEFTTHPLGPTVLAGLLLWPMDDAPEVLGFLREFAASAPDEVGMMGNLRLAPALPIIPEPIQGTPVVALVLTYMGDPDKGMAALRPALELGKPAVNNVEPKPYVMHQTMFDAALPHYRHYYWKSHKLGPLTDDVTSVVIDRARAITSGLSSIAIFTFGGAVARVPEDATAFPNRDASHDVNLVASWLPDDPEADRHVEWARTSFDALAPHSRGVYVNFTNDDTDDRIRCGAYSDSQWQRLVDVKRQYDPTNFFHGNANIRPD